MGTFQDPQGTAGSAGPQAGSSGYGEQGQQAPYGEQGQQAPYGPQGPQVPHGPQGQQAPYGPQGQQAPYGPYGQQAGYGPYGPYGPHGPYGTGTAGYPAEPKPPRRRRRAMLAVTAGAALAIGAGATWATTASGATSAALTTSQIVSKTDPAIVDVVSTLGNQNASAAGTGIVLTSTGEVLTNNHVINGATSIKVREVGDGRVYTASVVGYDATHDIAVIQMKGASGLQTANLGNSSSVKVGDKVVAIGNAGGQDGTPSVATGRVTGLDQSITASDEGSGTAENLSGLIRTDAGIQAGDSGGPLVNASGQVVGIDTAASSSPVQLNSSTSTQAFTIPINTALSIANQIESGTASTTVHIGATALLGVEIASNSQQFGNVGGGGAQLAGVQPGSGAANAGLAAGDVITAVGGHTVTSASGIRSALNGYHPGDKVSVSWTDQAGQSQSATVVLGSGPAA
jgi:S1-C subfamily serine protease